ncbi:MAG: class I SAM-dependent methyltransferase [Actinophytocola sp.]|uniref:class I SAM-dependent methyltransferase n=1 Tax=Actinophytocola sp. TaxID=1872138 RepID=UPI003C75EE2B
MAGWAGSRLSARVYDFGVEREWLARPAGVLLWGTDTRLMYETIRTIGAMPPGSSVLDVPCGGGLALRGMRPEQDLRYVAADISPVMLSRTRAQASRLQRPVLVTAADITRLPFGDNRFDLCVCFNGLHCLPDPAAAVREIARCLKDGAQLVGDTIVRGAGLRQDLALSAFHRVGLFGPGHTVDEVERWLSDAGLRVDRLTRSGAVAHFAATR